MKKIFLTQRAEAIIDDEDYELVSQFKWYLGRDEARTQSKKLNDSMQRLVMGMPSKDMIVIHKNGNRLDNRKENLMLGTKGTVNLTRGIQSNNNTGYRGVSRYKNGRFKAKISNNKRVYFLGYFDSAEAAAQAYNDQARTFWGKLAPLNDLSDIGKPKDDQIGRQKAYDTKVRKNERSRVQWGIYRKISSEAKDRLLKQDAQPKQIEIKDG